MSTDPRPVEKDEQKGGFDEMAFGAGRDRRSFIRTFPSNLMAATIALCLMAAACGGDSGESEPQGPTAEVTGPEATGPEQAQITVGALPIADYAAVYWAQENGFFADEGLEVEVVPLQGGPVGIEQVVSGEIEFSFTNLISVAIAIEGGAPIQVAVLTSSIGPDGGGIFVKPDSPIQDLEDLDGMTVATNTLRNVGDVLLDNLIDAEGVDVKPVYLEVPFIEMIAGIESGSIDAGHLPEQFKTAGLAAGLREVVNLHSGPNVALPISTFVTSEAFVESSPRTVGAFQRAMNAASSDIKANEDEFRVWLSTISETPPEAAAAMALPIFEDSLDPTKLQQTIDVIVRLGVLKESIDMADHVAVIPPS